MGHLAQITLTQHKAVEMLSAQSTMLTTLLLGSHAAPKLVLFLPTAEESSSGKGKGGSWLKKASKALSPADWLNHRVRVFFVDPITYEVAKTHPNKDGDAEGFELKFPKEWVAKAMPYVKLGLTVLKVAAAAGRLTALPIPDLGAAAGEWIDSQLGALGELKDKAIDEMSAMTKDKAGAKELLEAVDSKCQALLGEQVEEVKAVDGEPLEAKLKEPLEMSAKELDALLQLEYPNWKEQCGLVLAVHKTTGACEWVTPKPNMPAGYTERYDERAPVSTAPPPQQPPPPAPMQKSKSTLRALLGATSAKGGQSSKADPLTAGLRGLLAPLKLDSAMSMSAKVTTSKLELARAWCEENGAADVDDLKGLDNSDKVDFVEALQLKRLQAKSLCRALKVDENLIELLDAKLKAAK